MNKKEKIEQEIQKTLDLLDQPQNLAPNPFFYTRVRQRLDEKSQSHPKISLAAVLKPALMTVLLAMNLGTAIWYLGGTPATTSSQPRQELVQLLANDFQLETSQDNWLTLE